MCAMTPPRRLPPMPYSAVARTPISCRPGRIARASAPMMSPTSASQSSLNTSPRTAIPSTNTRMIASRITTASSSRRAELLAHALVDDSRIGLARGLLHHAPDEEAQQALLPVAVLLHLPRVRREDALDHRVELRGVGDDGLLEIGTGAEPVVADARERRVERVAADRRPCADELRKLGRVDPLGIDPRGDERVREHVRRLLRLRARLDHVGPQAVEPARHEHIGVVEGERAGDPADARARKLADAAAQPPDELSGRVHRY